MLRLLVIPRRHGLRPVWRRPKKGGEEHSEGGMRLAFLWRYDIFIYFVYIYIGNILAYKQLITFVQASFGRSN